MRKVKLGFTEVSNFGSPYIIAEIGANHNGSLELAKQMIDKVKELGCHCAKFQSFTADSTASKILYDQNPGLREQAETYALKPDNLVELAGYCKKQKIDFGCTPENKEELEFLLKRCQIKFIKIASQDADNIPFLEFVASKNMPTILSTGMATLADIDTAVRILTENGNDSLVILHCLSLYPPEDKAINLNNLDLLMRMYPYPIGYSDHSLGYSIPLAAIAKGASVIEKHFTMDKNMPGWDHKVSADPADMAIICKEGRRIHAALGSPYRTFCTDEINQRKSFRRSIVASKTLKKGAKIKMTDVLFKRPGTGIPPSEIDDILNCNLKRNVARDEIISWQDIG